MGKLERVYSRSSDAKEAIPTEMNPKATMRDFSNVYIVGIIVSSDDEIGTHR